MRLGNTVKGAAVLMVGLVVGGCAVRYHPATVTVEPIPTVVVTEPTVVVNRPLIVERRTDVYVNRPVVVEKRTVVVEKKSTVVVDKNHHDNGNHYGQKFVDPAARGDNAKRDDKDKKGVANSN